MKKKIGRNFEVFTRCDFIAAIPQHIADKSLQLVRYYGWYSNKMRGRRAKRADEEVQTEGDAVEVIDVSAYEPRRIPSKKWCELIKNVWEADPLRYPKCSREMRIVSLIDEEHSANPKKPVFDFRAHFWHAYCLHHFCHSAPIETHAFGFRLRANAPVGQKRFPIS